MSRRRLSKVSASAPDGSASSTIGRVLAVCTMATSVSVPDCSTSSHWAPTVCIQVPMLLASSASHRLRKVAIRNGAHADGVAIAVAGDSALITSAYPGTAMSDLLYVYPFDDAAQAGTGVNALRRAGGRSVVLRGVGCPHREFL